VGTAGATTIFTGSCVNEPGVQQAYQFTAPQAGALNVFFDQTDFHAIYILSGCAADAPELGCAFELGAVNAMLTAGETVTVVVEGANGSSYSVDAQFSPI
jgi:hypothetical protein